MELKNIPSMVRNKEFEKQVKTEFSNVYKFVHKKTGKEVFKAEIKKKAFKWRAWGYDARKLAIDVDKKLLQYGFEAINVLKKK